MKVFSRLTTRMAFDDHFSVSCFLRNRQSGAGTCFRSIQNDFCLKALHNFLSKRTRRIYLLMKIMVNDNVKNENKPYKKKHLRSLDGVRSQRQKSKVVSYINSLRKKKTLLKSLPEKFGLHATPFL